MAAHRILICSEEEGIQSGSFSSSCTETGAFSKRPAVIQCIREIKASPHSCLLADRLLEKPARGGSGRILSFFTALSHPQVSFFTASFSPSKC